MSAIHFLQSIVQRNLSPGTPQKTRADAFERTPPNPPSVAAVTPPTPDNTAALVRFLASGAGSVPTRLRRLVNDQEPISVDAALRAKFAAAGGHPERCTPAALSIFGRFCESLPYLPLSVEAHATVLPWAAAYCEVNGCCMKSLKSLLSLALTHPPVLQVLRTLEPSLRGNGGEVPVFDLHCLSSERTFLRQALAARLPADAGLSAWEPQAAREFVGAMAAWQRQPEDTLRVLQLAHHNRVPLHCVLDRAVIPALPAHAEAWLKLMHTLSDDGRLAVSQKTVILSHVAQLAAPESILTYLESLGSSPAEVQLRQLFWTHMVPAPPSPEAQARWLQVLPEKLPHDTTWRSPLAVLLPELHWQSLSRAAITGTANLYPDAWPQEQRTRGRALMACVRGAPLPAEPQDPELDLVRNPATWVQAGNWSRLLAAFGNPAWLRDLLQNETPRSAPEAALAQQNRLQGLGRSLHLHRNAGLDPSAEPSPSVAQILAHVPSQARRQSLLQAHLKKCLGRDSQAWTQCVQQLMQIYKTHDSRVLALVLELRTPGITQEQSVQALLNCAALGRDGQAWQRLFNLFADPSSATSALGCEVARWPTRSNLLQMLPEAAQADAPLALAQACIQDKKPNAANALRAQCKRSDNTSKVAAALMADYHSHGLAPDAIETYLQGERARLRQSLDWLAIQPDCAAAATDLGALLSLPAPAGRDKKRNAALTRGKADARAACKKLPAGPLRDWGELLSKQIERCFPVACRAERTLPWPSTDFYSQAPVRQFINQHVLPMVLTLQQFAGVFERLNVHVDTLHSPAAAKRRALSLFDKNQSECLWERIEAKVYKPELFLAYTALTQRWSTRYRLLGERRLRELTEAVLNDTHDALRRTSAQMQALLKDTKNPPWLRAWEQETPLPVGGAGCTALDTANVGKMLHATTEINSCQSVYGGSYNAGMMGRMLCGSKRMLLVHDADGKLRARAMLRLLRNQSGEPVLALSRIYGQDPKHRDMVGDYVKQRAKALGLPAANTYEGYGSLRLRSAEADLPDYWDDGCALTPGAQLISATYIE